jgi:hypothetical protein
LKNVVLTDEESVEKFKEAFMKSQNMNVEERNHSFICEEVDKKEIKELFK